MISLVLLCHILNEHAEPSVSVETIPDQSARIIRFEVVYVLISMVTFISVLISILVLYYMYKVDLDDL